jgi:hypothetical protein
MDFSYGEGLAIARWIAFVSAYISFVCWWTLRKEHSGFRDVQAGIASAALPAEVFGSAVFLRCIRASWCTSSKIVLLLPSFVTLLQDRRIFGLTSVLLGHKAITGVLRFLIDEEGQ